MLPPTSPPIASQRVLLCADIVSLLQQKHEWLNPGRSVGRRDVDDALATLAATGVVVGEKALAAAVTKALKCEPRALVPYKHVIAKAAEAARVAAQAKAAEAAAAAAVRVMGAIAGTPSGQKAAAAAAATVGPPRPPPPGGGKGGGGGRGAEALRAGGTRRARMTPAGRGPAIQTRRL